VTLFVAPYKNLASLYRQIEFPVPPIPQSIGANDEIHEDITSRVPTLQVEPIVVAYTELLEMPGISAQKVKESPDFVDDERNRHAQLASEQERNVKYICLAFFYLSISMTLTPSFDFMI
jgi:hypothetical protein